MGCGYGTGCSTHQNQLKIAQGGTSYGSRKNISPEECQTICDSSAECVGFNFQKKTPTLCWFRRSVTCNRESRTDRDCCTKKPTSTSKQLAKGLCQDRNGKVPNRFRIDPNRVSIKQEDCEAACMVTVACYAWEGQTGTGP